MRRTLNIPQSFIKHMNADDNYGYENFRLTEDKGVFLLCADSDDGRGKVTLIMYDVKWGWIMSLDTPIFKETLDLFVKLCETYRDLGDNIIKMTEYGIMGE